VRSGKASPSMLDALRVELSGAQMAMNQQAQVSTPEPRLILVTPFDKGQIKVIEKAIRESGLGLDPVTQGPVIPVPLPSMTEERRKDLTKIVREYAEDGRIAVR